MTTLAGIHIPGTGTYVACDQQLTIAGMAIGPRVKFVRHNGWAVGVAGHGRTLDLLEQFGVKLLAVDTPFEFIENVRGMMGEFEFTSEAPDGVGPQIYGQHFLLASAKGLWDIDMSLCAFKVPDNRLWAVGSGQDYALGASVLAAKFVEGPEAQLREMIAAATLYDQSTGFEPFVDLIDDVSAPAKVAKVAKPRKAALAGVAR